MTKTIRLTWFLALFLLALFFGGTPVYADEPTQAEASNITERAPDASKPTPTADAKGGSFSADQAKLKEMLTSLLEVSKNVNQEGAPGTGARKQVEEAINWDKVAQICMGGPADWRKVSAPNRSQFSRLLKEIISLTAYSRMNDFWNDTKYSIEKVKINGNSGVVSAKFMANDDEYVLDYYFEKTGSNWKIFDLSVDDDRYSDNITQQIKAFLKDNSFATLLQKLEKRRADLKNPNNKEKAKKASLE